jgi:acyl dehydratase
MQQRSQTDLLHFEDIAVGETVPFGRKVVSRDEIVEFARAFDPQPFHLDEEAAKHSLIGRLCASGWHSCAMLMRMLTDEVLNKSASLGSPGMEEVKWLKPVFPGDVLSGRYTCTAKRVLGSRPEVGLCHVLFEMLNQDGDVVMTWNSSQFFKVRSPSGHEPEGKPEARQ